MVRTLSFGCFCAGEVTCQNRNLFCRAPKTSKKSRSGFLWITSLLMGIPWGFNHHKRWWSWSQNPLLLGLIHVSLRAQGTFTPHNTIHYITLRYFTLCCVTLRNTTQYITWKWRGSINIDNYFLGQIDLKLRQKGWQNHWQRGRGNSRYPISRVLWPANLAAEPVANSVEAKNHGICAGKWYGRAS